MSPAPAPGGEAAARAAGADPIVRVEALTKRFGGLLAVQNVSFDVPRGSIYGLIGPNGAGKTTLFRLLGGIYPTTSGRVFLDGRQVAGLPAHRICRLGLVTTHQLVRPFAELSVLDNVRVGAHFGSAGSLSEAAALERAAQALALTGLLDRQDLPAHTLNLPQRKRLEVARALATQPRVLLLDEVLAGLNPSEIDRTMEMIRRIRATGVTIVMVEHLMRAIMGLSDRVMVLSYGRRIAEGTPSEVARNPTVIEAYLGDYRP